MAQAWRAPAGAVTGGAGASSGRADLTSLLEPATVVAPAVRSLFASGGVDPRLASVLQSAVTHHTIVVADGVRAWTRRTSGDRHRLGRWSAGGARERGGARSGDQIAAARSSLRLERDWHPMADRVTGLLHGSAHQNRLHLAFSSTGGLSARWCRVAAPADGAGVGAAAGRLRPLPATPAAQGVAQAAGSQLAADAQMAAENALQQPIGAAGRAGRAARRSERAVAGPDAAAGRRLEGPSDGEAGRRSSASRTCLAAVTPTLSSDETSLSGFDCSVRFSGASRRGYLNAPVDTTALPVRRHPARPRSLRHDLRPRAPGQNGHVIIEIDGQFDESGGRAGPWGGGEGERSAARCAPIWRRSRQFCDPEAL